MATPWAGSLRPRPELVVAWSATAAVVVATYVVVVLGGGTLIGRTSSPHLGLSVLATILVACTIEPARDRFERIAGQILRRRGESPYDVLAQFTSRTSGDGSADEIPARMAQVLAEGTHSVWAQVWLLVNDKPTLVATYPPEAAASRQPPRLNDADGTAQGMKSVTVGHAGRLLGVLRVQGHPNRPLSAVEGRLFAGLAAQAGLVLHTTQLRAELALRHRELSLRAAELRESRRQLVATQADERRRLERDIHDGAQQQLVALGINLRLAQTVADRTPVKAAQILREQAEAALDAIETLATLSRGAHPRVLTESGLSDALRAAAAGSPLPVATYVQDVGRLPAAVEAAVYFCCLEAMQNAAKHSDATRVAVRLLAEPGQVTLTVSDDGAGLKTGTVPGRGLANMRERLAAVGGSLTIESAPGAGTSVNAVVPVPRIPAQRVADIAPH